MFMPLNGQIVSGEDLVRNVKALIKTSYLTLANLDVKGQARYELEQVLDDLVKALTDKSFADEQHAYQVEQLGEVRELLSFQRTREAQAQWKTMPADSYMSRADMERLEQWMFDDGDWDN